MLLLIIFAGDGCYLLICFPEMPQQNGSLQKSAALKRHAQDHTLPVWKQCFNCEAK
jgi:hypothetical protein